MKKFLLQLCILLATAANANDGVFYATGNTLVPLKETTVRLKKEILNLQRKDEWMQVDIYFEFFNPGPVKELTVGFVTPPGDGDIGDEEAKHPFIKDFMVMAGDQLLPFKIAKMSETGFKTSAKVAEGYDFVYYFTIKFATGLTIVRHSYLYKGGNSTETQRDFDYRLTTGTTWANKAIDDFELNVNMGDDVFFSVPSAFGTAAANWQIAGIGRISKGTYSIPFIADGKNVLRMAYVRKGFLQLRATHFKPTEDLSVVFWNVHNEIALWCEPKVNSDFTDFMDVLWSDSTEAVSKLSDFQLRLYRNLNYARSGYDFKDETLKKAFSKYTWYIPDPNVKADDVVAYYVTKEMLQRISTEEERRKKINKQ